MIEMIHLPEDTCMMHRTDIDSSLLIYNQKEGKNPHATRNIFFPVRASIVKLSSTTSVDTWAMMQQSDHIPIQM
jgi:hypothetical protein